MPPLSKKRKTKPEPEQSDSESDSSVPKNKSKRAESNSSVAKKLKSKPADSESGSDSSGPTDRNVKNAVHKIAAKNTPTGSKDSGKNPYCIQEDDGLPAWQLDKLRTVKVTEFKGKQYINIREFYEKDGKKLPSKKGIALTPAQWKILVACVDDITSQING